MRARAFSWEGEGPLHMSIGSTFVEGDSSCCCSWCLRARCLAFASPMRRCLWTCQLDGGDGGRKVITAQYYDGHLGLIGSFEDVPLCFEVALGRP